MLAFNAVAMMLFQNAGVNTARDSHWTMIYSCIIACSLVAQAIGIVVAAVFAMKMFRKIESMTNSFQEKTAPILQKTSALLDDVGPRIRTISANVEQISYTAREKCDELGETVSQINRTVSDANIKTRVQVEHVNDLVNDALATTEEVSRTVQDGIRKPVRQIAGILAGLRAAMETLAQRSPFGKNKGSESPYDL